MNYEPLPITDEMVRRQIEWDKSELGKDISYDEAKAELEKFKDLGCLLYEDCRSCPLFGTGRCPM